MSNDMNGQEKVHSAKEVAALLGIQNSTIRKYAQLLEEAGYHIHKNELGHRGFFDKDVLVFRQIIEITKHPDMSLKNAINVVVSTCVRDDMSDRDTQEVASSPYITKTEFDEIQQRQMEFHRVMYERQEVAIKELMNRLDKQQEYIDRKLEKRDQLLIENIRGMQEAKKQSAAAEEQKKKWWRFWE